MMTQAPRPQAIKTSAKNGTTPAAPPTSMRRHPLQGLGTLLALALNLVWFGFIIWSVIKAGGFAHWLAGTTASAAITVSSLMLAPAALFWMILAYLQRASDVQAATEPLRRVLMTLAGNGSEARFIRINTALKEQIELLKMAGGASHKLARQALSEISAQNEALSSISGTAANRLLEASSALKANVGSFETILRAADAGLGGLDESSTALAKTLGLKIEAIETLLQRLDDRIERHVTTLHDAATERLEQAQKLQDDIERRGQAFAQTLRTLADDMLIRTRELDDSFARFSGNAEAVRRDTDKVASQLETQVRSLDHVSLQMRDRASEIVHDMTAVTGTLDLSAQNFATTAESWQSRLKSQEQTLAETTDRLGAHYRTMAAHLTQASADWGVAERQMAERVDAIEGRMNERARILHDAVDQITTHTDRLMDEAAEAGLRLAQSATDSADHHALICRATEAQGLKLLADMGTALDRQETLITRLDAQSGALASIATRASDTLETVAVTLDERTTTLAEIEKDFVGSAATLKQDSAELVSNFQNLADRLESTKNLTTEIGDQVSVRIVGAADEAARQVSALTLTADSAARTLAASAETLLQKTAHLSTGSQEATAALGAAETALASRAASVRQEIESISQSSVAQIDTVIRRMRALPQALTEESERSVTTLTDLADRIEDKTKTVAAVFGDSIAMLEDIATSGQAFFEKASAGLETHSLTLKTAAEQATEATRALFAAEEQAKGGLLTAASEIMDTTARLANEEERLSRQFAATSSAGDQLLIRAGEWRVKLADDATALLSTIEGSADSLMNARQNFAALAQGIANDVGGNRDALAALLSGAGNDLDNGARRLKEILQSASTYLAGFGAGLTQQIGTINQTEQNLGALITKLADGQQILDGTVLALTQDMAQFETRLGQLGQQLAMEGRNMQAQGESSSAHLTALTESLRIAGRDIGEIAGQAATTVETVATVYKELAHNGAAAVEGGLRNMAAAGEQGQALLANWNLATREQNETLARQQDGLEQAAAVLSASVLAAQEMLAMLTDRLTASGLAVKETGGETTAVLGKALGALETGLAQVSQTAQNAESKLAGATGKLQEEVIKLTAGTGHAAAQIFDLVQKCSDEGVKLRAALVEQSGEVYANLTRTLLAIEQAGETARQKTDAAYAMLDRISMRYAEVATQPGAAVEEGGGKLGAGISGLRDALEGLTRQIAEGVTSFYAAEQNLSAAVVRLGQQTENSQHQLQGAIELIGAGESRTLVAANTMAARLSEVSGTLDRQMQSLSQGADGAATALAGAGRSFAGETEQLRQQAHSLGAEVRSVTALAQQMREQAGSVLRALHEESVRMAESMSRTLADAQQIEAKWQQISGKTGGAIDGTVKQLQDASAAVAARLAADRQSFGEFAAHFDSALKAASGALAGQMTALIDSASNAFGRIVETDKQLTANRTSTLSLLDSVTEKLHSAGFEIKEAVTHVVHASGAADSSLANLTARANQAAEALTKAGTAASIQVRALTDETSHAEQSSKALVGVSADLYEKTRAIREGMLVEHEQMMDALNRALAQLELAESNIGRQHDSIKARLDDAAQNIGEAGRSAAVLLETQIGNLRLAAADAGEQLRLVAANLEEHREDALTSVHMLLDGSKALAIAGKDALAGGKDVEARLGQFEAGIRDLLDRLHGKVKSASTELAQLLANLAEGAEQTVSSVHAAAAEVGRETGQLAVGTDQVLTQVIKTTQAFSGSVTSLERDLTKASANVTALITGMKSESEKAAGGLQSLFDMLVTKTELTSGRLIKNGESLGQRAQDVASLMDGLTVQLNNQLAALDNTLDHVANTARTAFKAVEGVNGTFGERANEFEGRVSRLQTNLASQSAKLASSLAEIIRQVEATGEDVAAETAQKIG